MYTTANFLGKSPIITQLEKTTEALIAAKANLQSCLGEFTRSVTASLLEQRLIGIENATAIDRKGGHEDLRWLRDEQFQQAEALNHVGYTRTRAIAAMEEYNTLEPALRQLVRDALENVITVDGWQHSALTNAIVYAQKTLNTPLPVFCQPQPGWLEDMPGLEDIVEQALAKAFDIVRGVVDAAVVEPNFTVKMLLNVYPTEPVAVSPMERGLKRTPHHRPKDYRYVHTFALPERLQSTFPRTIRIVELCKELQAAVDRTHRALNTFRATEGARLNEGQHRAKLHELMNQADSADAIAKQIAKQSNLRLDYISAREAFRYALTLTLQKRAELVLALKLAVVEATDFASAHPAVSDATLSNRRIPKAWEQAMREAPADPVSRMRELLEQPSAEITEAHETRFQRQSVIVNCLAADLTLRAVGDTLADWVEHLEEDLTAGQAAKEIELMMEQARKTPAVAAKMPSPSR